MSVDEFEFTVLSLTEGRLIRLRREWRFWYELDLDKYAGRTDLIEDGLLADAGGDVALAWLAWRASILARLEVCGAAAQARLEAERRAA